MKVRSLIHENRFVECLDIDIAEDYECWMAHWHKPEIGAANLLQSTHVEEDIGAVCSYRSNVFFTVGAQQKETPVSLALRKQAGTSKSGFAYNRLPDILNSINKKDDVLGYHFSAHDKTSKPWLGLESNSFEAIGSTDAFAVWPVDHKESFILSYSLEDHIDKIHQFPKINFESCLKKSLLPIASGYPAKSLLPITLMKRLRISIVALC